MTEGLPTAGTKPTGFISVIGTAILLGKIYRSDSCNPIDLRDGTPREVGNEVLLQCLVALCHCTLFNHEIEVRTVWLNSADLVYNS